MSGRESNLLHCLEDSGFAILYHPEYIYEAWKVGAWNILKFFKTCTTECWEELTSAITEIAISDPSGLQLLHLKVDEENRLENWVEQISAVIQSGFSIAYWSDTCDNRALQYIMGEEWVAERTWVDMLAFSKVAWPLGEVCSRNLQCLYLDLGLNSAGKAHDPIYDNLMAAEIMTLLMRCQEQGCHPAALGYSLRHQVPTRQPSAVMSDASTNAIPATTSSVPRSFGMMDELERKREKGEKQSSTKKNQLPAHVIDIACQK